MAGNSQGQASDFRNALLPMVDAMRNIPNVFGLRLHTVAVVQRSWTGSGVGLGTKTDVVTGIKIDLGIGASKVRNLSQREVIASGGLYTEEDVMVGPFTPPYAGSTADNDAINIFDPPVPAITNDVSEILFRITGPGYPPTGAYFKKIEQRVDKPFRYTMVLRKTGEVAP